MNSMNAMFRIFAAAVVSLLVGCTGFVGPRTVANEDAAVKIPAIKQAVQENDAQVIPQLVRDLDSDDPAVRFYAIEGLERLTGQTFGYVYYADPPARREATLKWQQWLNDQGR